MSIKIFADGADLQTMVRLNENPLIQGFTTNPTLLRKACVTDYKRFIKQALDAIKDKPISFEVVADDFYGMRQQAMMICEMGANAVVKIPIALSDGTPTLDLVRRLSGMGATINVTAMTTRNQIYDAAVALDASGGYLSVFCGRIADTGIDPMPLMREAVFIAENKNAQLIWASPREIYNLYQAEQVGCHVITLTTDLIEKMSLTGKSLDLVSLETVRQFWSDAQKSGLTL